MGNDNEADKQYQQATKAVDDAMRTDTLGPNLCKTLKDHKPANDLVKEIMLDAIKSDADIKKALNDQQDEHENSRKGKGMSEVQKTAITAGITAFVTVLVTLAVTAAFSHYFQPQNKDEAPKSGVVLNHHA